MEGLTPAECGVSAPLSPKLHPKTSPKDFGAGMGCAGTAGLLRERQSPGPVNVMVLGVVKIQSR
jgi:hypothetical protein